MPRRVAVGSGARSGLPSRRARIVTIAKYSKNRPKTTASAEVGISPARKAPASAPVVVATSMNMPTRMFE